MLKQILFLLLFIISFDGFSQVQPDYNADLIPAALKIRADAVIRDMETTVDMRSPENVMINIKKAITVLNKNGDATAELRLYYDKSTAIKSVKGAVMDATGKSIGKFSLSDFKDESAVNDFSLFEDTRIKHYNPSILSYPFTIVYEYEIRQKQNLIIPDWHVSSYSDLSVVSSTYTFIAKPEDQLHIKAYNYKGDPEVIKSEKSITRIWKASNVPAFKIEPYSPNPDEYRIHVKIAPQQFSYYGFKGSYQNWKELGKWVFNNLIKERQTLSPVAINDVKNLVKGMDSDKEKARKIYEYVQQKTRYISVQVGIGGFQPFPAEEVDRLSYGDCKALVNYTQSLLKAVNINSYYCVVSAGDAKKNIDPDFANMQQGNHVILCLPLKNDTTWLECTSQDTPFGYLGTFTDDRTTFACTETGGMILKTPALSTLTNSLKRKAELTITADGSIEGSLKTDFSGAQYDNYDHLVKKSHTEQLKLLKNEYDIDNINFSDFKLSQKKGNNPVTSESLNLTIEKYAPKTDNRMYLVPNIFNKTRAIPDVRNRTLPVYINRGYTDEDELVYNIPEGYTIEARPEDKLINSPFGSYSINIKTAGKNLVYTRKLVINEGRYPADKYAGLASFFNEVSHADNAKVIFKIN